MEDRVYLYVAIMLIICPLVSSDSKWGYSGKSGPDNWHQLFKPCAGKKQSPIDVKAEESMYDPGLKDFAIWYDPPKPDSNITVKNNGHTLQVDLEGQFYVSNGGLKHVYKAAQFHFHWGAKVHHGSEHLMEGKASPIEMHLVTYDSELYEHIGLAATETDGLAVLGTMFEISDEDNPAFASIIKAIKYVRDPHTKRRIRLPLDSLSIRNILPRDISRYFRYQGSLTTPHCHESVIWTVFDQKQTISEAQLKQFRTLLQYGHHHHQDSAAQKDAVVESGDSKDSAESTRHRRSLTRGHTQDKFVRDVLVELGIKGDHKEEAYLKETKQEPNTFAEQGMFADQPPQQGNLIETEKIVSGEYVLVDNYRPVQPLHGRVVYRSFKLREPVVSTLRTQSQQQQSVGYKTVETSAGSQVNSHPCDGATSLWASLLVLMASLLFTVLLAV